MSILPVAISNSEVPEVLNFGKILYYEEVVLVGFRDSVSCLTSPRKIGKLWYHVFHFLDISLWFTILLSWLRLSEWWLRFLLLELHFLQIQFIHTLLFFVCLWFLDWAWDWCCCRILRGRYVPASSRPDALSQRLGLLSFSLFMWIRLQFVAI